MRIAMISYHTCPLAILGGKDTGGMNVYVRELTRVLGKLGITVDVYTRSQDEHVPHISHDLGYGNRVVHISAGPEIPLKKQELTQYLPMFSESIIKFAADKGFNYDLIHSHYWMSGTVARELKYKWQVPVVHMFHTLGLMKQRINSAVDDSDGEDRIKEEKEILGYADRIVAATPAEFAQLQWLYNAETKRLVVIPPGVDTSHFYPIPADEAKDYIGIDPDVSMLLYVGRIEPLKGIDILIRAIKIMSKEGVLARHKLGLSIIGGDPDATSGSMSKEMSRLQVLRDSYGLTDLVTFLGKRSQDTLPYYYSAAEAVIMPSHYESFGMVALESMACATPVVASQVGGLAFLVQDGITGFHVPVDSPEELSDRLTLLLEDQYLRRRLGEQAVCLAREYAWEVIAARVVDLYNELIK